MQSMPNKVVWIYFNFTSIHSVKDTLFTHS